MKPASACERSGSAGLFRLKMPVYGSAGGKETAEVLGIREGNVKARLSRARLKMRNGLPDHRGTGRVRGIQQKVSPECRFGVARIFDFVDDDDCDEGWFCAIPVTDGPDGDWDFCRWGPFG